MQNLIKLDKRTILFKEQEQLAKRLSIDLSNYMLELGHNQISTKNWRIILMQYCYTIAYKWIESNSVDNLFDIINNMSLCNVEIKHFYLSKEHKKIYFSLASVKYLGTIINSPKSNKLKHRFNVNILVKIKHNLLRVPELYVSKEKANIEFKRVLDIDKFQYNYNFLLKLAKIFIPSCFLEHYDFYQKSLIAQLNQDYKNIEIYTSHGLHYDDLSLIILGILKTNYNTNINIFQHGGTYFMMRNFVVYNIEKEYVNKYYIWGKSSKNNVLTRDGFFSKRNLFVLIIIKIIRKFYKKNYKSLIMPSIQNHNYRFDGFFQVQAAQELLSDIDNCNFKKENFKIIGHPVSKINLIENVAKSNIDLNVVFPSYFKMLLESKFLIILYNSTVIHEACISGVPFTIYLNEHRDDFFLEDEDLYIRMKNSRLLLTLPKSLKLFNNEILCSDRNLSSWWSSIEVRSTVKDFTNKYIGL